MIDGVRQRVYHIDSEIVGDSYRLAVLEAIEKKMAWWMAEKSQVNWNEQPLEQPTPPHPPYIQLVAAWTPLPHLLKASKVVSNLKPRYSKVLTQNSPTQFQMR
jgi:hypothetical protein